MWCQQCGFRCNLERDSKNINEFAGESITSGNVLSNGSFEDWTAGSPDNWTVSGSVTQETTDGFFDPLDKGVSSVKIVRSGSEISLSQAASTPSDFNSNVLRFRVRVKSVTNGVVRLKVDINGTEHTSAYNIAQQRFQELGITVTAPVSVSSLTVYILIDNKDGTAYVDSAILSRDGAPTTAAVTGGCPMCGSFNYHNRPEPLTVNQTSLS